MTAFARCVVAAGSVGTASRRLPESAQPLSTSRAFFHSARSLSALHAWRRFVRPDGCGSGRILGGRDHGTVAPNTAPHGSPLTVQSRHQIPHLARPNLRIVARGGA